MLYIAHTHKRMCLFSFSPLTIFFVDSVLWCSKTLLRRHAGSINTPQGCITVNLYEGAMKRLYWSYIKTLLQLGLRSPTEASKMLLTNPTSEIESTPVAICVVICTHTHIHTPTHTHIVYVHIIYAYLRYYMCVWVCVCVCVCADRYMLI